MQTNILNKAGVGLALMAGALGATGAHAQNFQFSQITLNGGAAPTAPITVGQTADASVNDGSHDFTDNAGAPGQTFTTPTGASRYMLLGLTLKGSGVSGYANNGNPEAGNFQYRVSSVSGNALTPLSTYSASAAPLATNNQFFTVGTNQIVAPNTQYAFDLYSDKGYFGLTSSTGDKYSGGASYNLAGGSSRAFDSNTTTPNANDRTFAAEFAVLNSATITDTTTFTAAAGTTNIGQMDASRPADGATDFSDNGPHPGQTFTTGNAPSYSLKTLTVKGSGASGRAPDAANFFVRISKVGTDGATLAPLAIFTAPGTPLAGNANTDFLTFDLSAANLTLVGNAQYAYDIFTDGTAYYGFASGAATNVPAGQSALEVSGVHSFGLDNSFTSNNYSRTFNVGLIAAAPEPSQFAALGLGALGLGTLALRARKRSQSC